MNPESPITRSPGTVWANNLGKRYSLYRTPMERLRAALFPGSVKAQELVALEGVSFEITPGTAVGVIGPNGAGKSTLLKILSGVLTPTAGTMGVHGRIGSIIELGAGFHPEFTGRDNILMNAELHGLTREEAASRVESIAQFSELGRYFDMPVRTYSSGMFVRLAFSLAVSVDPDVLLVDEALAVGDAVFVHRCLTRIRELRERGVTIFLVTHDTPTVANLCDRALLIQSGSLAADGTPKEVIHRYLVHIAERLTRLESGDGTGFQTVGAHDAATSTETIAEARFGTFEARILDCAIEDSDGHRITQVLAGTEVSMRMIVQFERDVQEPIFGVMIRNRFGVEMFGTNTHLRQDPVPSFKHGQCASVVFRMPMWLDSGAYGVSFAVHSPDGNYFDYRTDAIVLEVIAPGDAGGLVRLPTTFEVTRLEPILANTDDTDPLQLAFSDAPSQLNLTQPDAHRFLSGGWSPADSDVTRGLRLTGEGRIVLGTPTTPNPPSAWRLLIVRSDNNAPAPWPSMEVWVGSTLLNVGTPSPDTKSLACTISLPNLPPSRVLPIRIRLREAGTHLDIQSISVNPELDTGD